MKAFDFIQMLSDEIDCTYVDARTFLRGFRKCVEKVLMSGGYVKLHGLGAFRLKRLGKRRNYDLNSGRVVELEPATRIVFIESKGIRKRIENVIPLDNGDDADDEDGETDA